MDLTLNLLNPSKPKNTPDGVFFDIISKILIFSCGWALDFAAEEKEL